MRIVRRHLVISVVLLIVGMGLLIQGVNGTASVNLGYPLRGSGIHFSGASTGGWAIAGGLATLGGIFFLALALIRSFTHKDGGAKMSVQSDLESAKRFGA